MSSMDRVGSDRVPREKFIRSNRNPGKGLTRILRDAPVEHLIHILKENRLRGRLNLVRTQISFSAAWLPQYLPFTLHPCMFFILNLQVHLTVTLRRLVDELQVSSASDIDGDSDRGQPMPSFLSPSPCHDPEEVDLAYSLLRSQLMGLRSDSEPDMQSSEVRDSSIPGVIRDLKEILKLIECESAQAERGVGADRDIGMQLPRSGAFPLGADGALLRPPLSCVDEAGSSPQDPQHSQAPILPHTISLHPYLPGCLASILHSLGRARVLDSELVQLATSCLLPRSVLFLGLRRGPLCDWFLALAEWCRCIRMNPFPLCLECSYLGRCDGRQLANICWGLARLNYRPTRTWVRA